MNNLRYLQISGCILFLLNWYTFVREIKVQEASIKHREEATIEAPNNHLKFSESDTKIRDLEDQIDHLNSRIKLNSTSSSQYFAVALVLFPQLILWNNKSKINSKQG